MGSLLQALLRNESGGRNIPNVRQGTSSGQAQGYFQITTGTWNDFGGRQFAATPLQATYRQQAEIASRIPLRRWDESTVAQMRATGKRIDPNRTLGENLAAHGESFGSGGKAMKFPYRLEGGGRRPDAISGMQQPFNQALLAMYQAAPPEVQRELGIASGYRSYKVQKALWDASDKTGHSVARPGSSKHEHGTAADLYGFGLRNTGAVSQNTKDWVHQNAGQFGLYFPMKHEPWHVQLQNTAGLRHVGGAGSGAAYYGQDPVMTGESGGGGGGGDSASPGGIAGFLGDELKGEDKEKSVGGLLGDLLKPEQPKLLQSNLTAPPGGGAAGVQSLPEYIQQFIAMRMKGQPPSGGIPGTGGQGIG